MKGVATEHASDASLSGNKVIRVQEMWDEEGSSTHVELKAPAPR